MTIQGVSFHPSPGGQFSAVVDSRDLGRPQEACDPRRRPRRLVLHRDLTRCWGCRGRVTAPAPTLQNLALASYAVSVGDGALGL
jgi:hypothetical protein